MTSPDWTDDELLGELGAALREQEVEERFIQAAEMAFTWHNVDAELETLGLAADGELAGAPRVRAGGDSSPRLLSFRGERVSLQVEVDETGLAGQITPPGPGQVTLITADGPQVTVAADEVGYFTLPLASGPIRLDCACAAGRFITEWTTL